MDINEKTNLFFSTLALQPLRVEVYWLITVMQQLEPMWTTLIDVVLLKLCF